RLRRLAEILFARHNSDAEAVISGHCPPPAEACKILFTRQNSDAETVISGHCPPAQPPAGHSR
ncbi:hypothetical protein J7L01_07970, partial [bacterium]|nr:hypothetical protein [bacterium]